MLSQLQTDVEKTFNGVAEKKTKKDLPRLFRSLSLQQFFLQDYKNFPCSPKNKEKIHIRGKSFDNSEKSKEEEENLMCDSTSSSLNREVREGSTTSFKKELKKNKIT